MGPFLELWEVDGKGIFTKGCWRSADPLQWGSLSLICFQFWIMLALSLLGLCEVSSKAGTKHFIVGLKNILAKRDNAKAEWAKIRPSGAVWLGSCVHRLLTWHPPPASLPAALCLLRAQVTCWGRGSAASAGTLWGWQMLLGYVTATWSSMLSNRLKGYASPSADLHIKIKPYLSFPLI